MHSRDSQLHPLSCAPGRAKTHTRTAWQALSSIKDSAAVLRMANYPAKLAIAVRSTAVRSTQFGGGAAAFALRLLVQPARIEAYDIVDAKVVVRIVALDVIKP